MCFFDGLTTYVKTWLQFVFPLYILALVGVMIIASKYSVRVTRLFGTNAVSVLATLILLSYTKILRILITAFSFTTLTGSQDYHSVVWLADGNIKYFQPKHAIYSLPSGTSSAPATGSSLYSHSNHCSLDTEVKVQVGVLSVQQVEASV